MKSENATLTATRRSRPGARAALVACTFAAVAGWAPAGDPEPAAKLERHKELV